MGNAQAFVDDIEDGNAAVDFATQTNSSIQDPDIGTMYGEYFQGNYAIIHHDNTEVGDYISITHEGQHHAGYLEDQITNDSSRRLVEDAIAIASYDCITFPRKEREDDDDPQCGPNADCGGGTTPTVTCTDTQVYVRWTDWEWVPGTEGESYTDDGGGGTGGCWWQGDELLGCTTVVLPGITIVPGTEGYWQDVDRGEWRTQTVCVTNMVADKEKGR